MKNLSKKHVNSNINTIKNAKKIFSLITIFLILTTTTSSIVSSQSNLLNLVEDNMENNDTDIDSEQNIIKQTTLKEKVSRFEEKIIYNIQELTQSLNTLFNDEKNEIESDNENSFIYTKSQKSPIIRSFGRFLRAKLLNMTIMFYTNYSGNEKQTNIKFLQAKKIDVNDDGKDDIKVKLGLSFSIEKFLRFSINFKNLITLLPDFPDKLAHFEAYTELYFPGLLFIRQKGDRIRFGYESPQGEEIPNNCQIIYRFLPNIIYLRKKPEHRIEINPGKNNNNSRLIMLLGYTNFNINNTFVSELNSRVIYNPAVKSTISIGGNGILGGSIFEFAREHSDESQVDMYCSFEKNNKTIIGYVKDLPKKVTFTINFGRDGNIIFDTHNQVPSEIGVCDDFYNPDYKIYFTNLPTKAELNWNRRLIIQKKIDISFYTNSPGIYLKGEFNLANNSTANFNIFSKENLDCQMTLDLKNKHFVFNRNKFDISIDLSYNDDNTKLDFSTDLSSFYDKPFEIFFDKIFNGTTEVLFYGSYLEISDLNFIFSKSTSNTTSDSAEQFFIMSLSSLRLTSRDFIKLKIDNETKEVNLFAGGNGSIKLKDLFIKCHLLKLSPGCEARLELFEIESDHLYGSAVNVSLNFSDIKNFTFESITYENAISKFIIENFTLNLNLNDILNIKEVRFNFSGSGVISFVNDNKSKFGIDVIISGPGSFEIEAINIDSNLFNSSHSFLIEDLSVTGPTTFFLQMGFELNQNKLTNISFIAGVDSYLHLGELYLKAFNIPLIKIINFNGKGQLSGGIKNFTIRESMDIVFSLSGNLDWKKIYFLPFLEELERPGIQSGTFSGNFTFVIHLGKNINFSGIVYSNTKLDHFKLEGSSWSISAVSLQMKPGNFDIHFLNLNLSKMHLLMNNSGTIDLEFDTILIENKNTGKNFSFRSREASIPHLEIMTEINGDGNGFIYLDTDNKFCSYEITKSEFIKINKTFRAENCKISWNFSGGLFNIIDIQGFIEFGKEFEILVFLNGKWRILISINEPVANFTWSPTEPNINETIQFDASSSYFSEPITRYDWKWSSTDVWHNNLGPYPTHAYTKNGSYKVTLRVWSGLKQSTCSKIVSVGESNFNVNIIFENETLFEGHQFSVLVLDINSSPIPGIMVTYAQVDCFGNWQNITNITDSEGIASFIALDVPENGYANYSNAEIYVGWPDCTDNEIKMFEVYDFN